MIFHRNCIERNRRTWLPHLLTGVHVLVFSLWIHRIIQATLGVTIRKVGKCGCLKMEQTKCEIVQTFFLGNDLCNAWYNINVDLSPWHWCEMKSHSDGLVKGQRSILKLLYALHRPLHRKDFNEMLPFSGQFKCFNPIFSVLFTSSIIPTTQI